MDSRSGDCNSGFYNVTTNQARTVFLAYVPFFCLCFGNIFTCLLKICMFFVVLVLINLYMKVSIVRKVINAIYWTGKLYSCRTLQNFFECLSESQQAKFVPLWIFHQQTLTHKQMLLWHRRTVSSVTICSPAVQAASSLAPLPSEVCAILDRKHPETMFFIQKSFHGWSPPGEDDKPFFSITGGKKSVKSLEHRACG